MKLHSTLIENLINVFEINSGWEGQRKLRDALTKLDVTIYTQGDGTQVLVPTSEYNQQLRDQRKK